MKYVLSLTIAMLLVGCESEVDKCVKAGLNEDEYMAGKKLTKEDIKGSEINWRVICLRAAAGK